MAKLNEQQKRHIVRRIADAKSVAAGKVQSRSFDRPKLEETLKDSIKHIIGSFTDTLSIQQVSTYRDESVTITHPKLRKLISEATEKRNQEEEKFNAAKRALVQKIYDKAAALSDKIMLEGAGAEELATLLQELADLANE